MYYPFDKYKFRNQKQKKFSEKTYITQKTPHTHFKQPPPMYIAWAYVKGLLKPRPCAYVLRFAFPYDLLCVLLVVGFGYGLQVVSLFVLLCSVGFGWWACLLSIALLLGFIGWFCGCIGWLFSGSGGVLLCWGC